jgi:hypothetical protein
MSALNQGKDTEERQTDVVEIPTKAYNLVWIAPRNFPVPTEQFFGEPIPHPTIANMYGIAERNPDGDIRLWVDSRRMNDAEMGWLERTVGECSSNNLTLHDFREVPEYREHPLYNQSDYSVEPHFQKDSLIWRQVDAARILACLCSPHDQVFYSDIDITNLVVNSSEVQKRLKKHGIILAGGVFETGNPWYENQLFGFDRRKRKFFRQLYERTLTDAVKRRKNGYPSYVKLIESELEEREGIDTRDIVFQVIRDDGTVPRHPQFEFTEKKLDTYRLI